MTEPTGDRFAPSPSSWPATEDPSTGRGTVDHPAADTPTADITLGTPTRSTATADPVVPVVAVAQPLPGMGSFPPAGDGGPVPPTGDARVDDAMGRLADLAGLPVAEHLAVYEDVQRRLHDALADLDER